MNIEIKEDLKEGILVFIKGQQGYNVDEVEEITVTNKDEKTGSFFMEKALTLVFSAAAHHQRRH